MKRQIQGHIQKFLGNAFGVINRICSTAIEIGPDNDMSM
jgi:hypothetical protein